MSFDTSQKPLNREVNTSGVDFLLRFSNRFAHSWPWSQRGDRGHRVTVDHNVLSSGRMNAEAQRGQDTYPKSHRYSAVKLRQLLGCSEGEEHLAWVVSKKNWKIAHLCNISYFNRREKAHCLKIEIAYLWFKISEYSVRLEGSLAILPLNRLAEPHNHGARLPRRLLALWVTESFFPPERLTPPHTIEDEQAFYKGFRKGW